MYTSRNYNSYLYLPEQLAITPALTDLKFRRLNEILKWRLVPYNERLRLKSLANELKSNLINLGIIDKEGVYSFETL